MVGGGLGVDAERDELLLGFAEGFEAGDDFLAQVAAFFEGDAVVEDAGLVGERVGAEVDVVEGDAGLDARDVDGVPAAGAELDARGQFGW